MNNRGSVLISVLIFVAFCAFTAIFVYEHSMKSFEKTADDFYENQSDIYGISAMTAAKEILSEDDNPYDTDDDDWVNIPVTKVPYGTVELTVRPVDSHIDLNVLADKNGTAYKRFYDACERVFDDEGVKNVSCAEIADYTDTDGDTTSGGREDADYTFNGVTLRTKNALFSSAPELKLLFDERAQYELIKKYFTAGDAEGTLNINFADADTIKELLPELSNSADRIVNHAHVDGFKDVSDIKNVAGITDSAYLAILPYISVKSSLFYARTKVTLNGKTRFYHGLLKRSGTTVKIVRFQAGLDERFY